MSRATPEQVAEWTGSATVTEFVPRTARMSPHPAELRHLDRAGEIRREAEDLVADMENVLDYFGRLPMVPLDILDRMERAVVAAHVANLERIGRVSDRALLALEGEG